MRKNAEDRDEPVILWLGGAECRELAETCRNNTSQLFSESADILYDKSVKYAAAVLVPESDDLCESELFREVCRYSSEKRRTVLFAGSGEQLFAAYPMYPDMLLRSVRVDELRSISELLPIQDAVPHTIAVFSDTYELPALIEDLIEENGLAGINVLYAHAHYEGVSWVLSRKADPDMIVFCGDVLSTGIGLSEAISRVRTLRRKPYIVLHYSDKAPYSGEAPLAVLDIRKDCEKLVDILKNVYQGKIRRP